MNMGVRKGTFIKLFEAVPKRPGAGGIVEMDYDFSAVDQILPHPVYTWMGWISVLNPSENIGKNACCCKGEVSGREKQV